MNLIYHLMAVLIFLNTSTLLAKSIIVEQDNINFPIKTSSLMEGEIHLFFTTISREDLISKFPQLIKLDTLSLLNKKKDQFVILKSVYVVRQPVGFFDENHFLNEEFYSKMHESKVIKKIDNARFKVKDVASAIDYQAQIFIDADDLSTLPNSKINQAVIGSKELDVIAKSATTVVFTEKTKFSDLYLGGINVSSFIPVNEHKTLVISYELALLNDSNHKDLTLKADLFKEIKSLKRNLSSLVSP